MDHQSFLQDRLPEGHPARVCFGCGADNHLGLRIKSFMDNGTAICRFRPGPHHTAFPGVLNGGIIATLLDCHGVWTAVGHVDAGQHGSEASESSTMFVTRRMTVDYLRPTPVDEELVLKGWVVREGSTSMTVQVELLAGETVTAQAEVVAVRAASGS
jgi:acyl-coenzyme A thioesterase PaaI-like protein